MAKLRNGWPVVLLLLERLRLEINGGLRKTKPVAVPPGAPEGENLHRARRMERERKRMFVILDPARTLDKELDNGSSSKHTALDGPARVSSRLHCSCVSRTQNSPQRVGTTSDTDMRRVHRCCYHKRSHENSLPTLWHLKVPDTSSFCHGRCVATLKSEAARRAFQVPALRTATSH